MDLYQIQVRKEARSGRIHCGPKRLRIVLCRFRERCLVVEEVVIEEVVELLSVYVCPSFLFEWTILCTFRFSLYVLVETREELSGSCVRL